MATPACRLYARIVTAPRRRRRPRRCAVAYAFACASISYIIGLVPSLLGLAQQPVGVAAGRAYFRRLRLAALLRRAAYVVILASAAAFYAGYDPRSVTTYW